MYSMDNLSKLTTDTAKSAEPSADEFFICDMVMFFRYVISVWHE